jgi:hypothetical protein
MHRITILAHLLESDLCERHHRYHSGWVMTSAWMIFPYDYIAGCEPGSSVSRVSDYGLDGQGLIPNRGRAFFL